MGRDAGSGVVMQSPLDHLPGMDGGPVHRPVEQLLAGQHSVAAIQKQDGEGLPGPIPQTGRKIIPGGGGRFDGLPPVQALAQVAPGHLGDRPELEILGPPQAGRRAEGGLVGGQQGPQAPEARQQVPCEVDRGAPGCPGAQEDGKQLGIGEGLRAALRQLLPGALRLGPIGYGHESPLFFRFGNGQASTKATGESMAMDRICVFAGSGTGHRPEFTAAATALGRMLGDRGVELVYGGGHTGLMGHLADAAMEVDGRVTGVIPEPLWDLELGHEGITNLEVVDSMHTRKARMAELADGFIALPGGIGTLEELFEVFTWAQLGLHTKPCGLLDVGGYYEPLIRFLNTTVQEGFLRPDQRELLLVGKDPGTLLEELAVFEAPHVRRWITPDET